MKNVWPMVIFSCLLMLLIKGCSPKKEMGVIVFTSTKDGNAEIYTMRADGRKQRRLTNNEYADEAPCWSPDMKRIVFSSNRTGNWDIFIMNSDGTSPVQLTTDPGEDRFPSWSPNGGRIVFQTNRTGTYKLFVINADGTEERCIEMIEQLKQKDDSKEKKADYTHPVWSPDGTFILFTKEKNKSSTIWKMRPDGKNLVQLTKTNKKDTWPSLSPDGKTILFSSNESDTFQIYLMDVKMKSKTLMNMVYVGHNNIEPRWSPSGGNIVFVSSHRGKREIFRKKVISGNDVESLQKKRDREIQLTRNKADNYHPCWGIKKAR